MNYKERIILALDTDNLDRAKELILQLKGRIKIFKVGNQLFTQSGKEIIELLQANNCSIFLDLKFHDIPNTVARAGEEATKLGVFMFNIHTSGGHRMMKECVESCRRLAEERGQERPYIIGVTILTSLGEKDLIELGFRRKMKDQVLHLAHSAKEAGLDGVVCSPQEVRKIKALCGEGFLTVVPGIRPSWSLTDDHQRLSTPTKAFEEGADFIVIGRPITEASDPVEATLKIHHEIESLDI
jgi:orotidine-5'-phosphate decarboxylase